MKRASLPAFRLSQDAPPVGEEELRLMLGPAGRALMDLLEEGVVVFTPAGEIALMNRAAREGLSSGRLAASPGADRPLPVESFARAGGANLAALVSGQSTGLRRARIARPAGGGELDVLLHTLPSADGTPGHRIALFPGLRPGADDDRAPPSRPAQASGALVYQHKLEPLIELGSKAFRARRRILLLGETGVGKTTLAMQMHRQTGDPGRPFVHVNCTSISESLFEAEMFGYERGAFTGALAAGKKGFIEEAAGGTLFLDEIGDMPLTQQAKLLKFLEDGTIQPVGSPRAKSVDAYVVCATNRDLQAEVRARRFREDLYYRVAMIPLDVPPLRAYREELPEMIDTLVANLNLTRSPALSLSPACRALMIAHDYPGNMRELIGLISRLDVVADSVAETWHLPEALTAPAAALIEAAPERLAAEPAEGSLKERVRAYERRLIADELTRARSKREAARRLGIDVASLIRKMQA